MKEYLALLNKMSFMINSTIIDNDLSTQNHADESEIMRTNKQMFVDMKVMMMRLERLLYGAKVYDFLENKAQISDRNACESNDTKNRTSSTCSTRAGNFSC